MHQFSNVVADDTFDISVHFLLRKLFNESVAYFFQFFCDFFVDSIVFVVDALLCGKFLVDQSVLKLFLCFAEVFLQFSVFQSELLKFLV